VARKRHALDDKLSGAVKPKGWADIIVAPGGLDDEDAPEAEPLFVKKTYILRPDMVNAIAELAKEERVQVNELVRFLLGHALEDVKNGKLTIRATTEVRRIVS
jgi:hypothetical protein